jgi:hypothetical protein
MLTCKLCKCKQVLYDIYHGKIDNPQLLKTFVIETGIYFFNKRPIIKGFLFASPIIFFQYIKCFLLIALVIEQTFVIPSLLVNRIISSW